MNFFSGLFSKKSDSDRLLDESAKICEDAFVEAAKETLKTTGDDLTDLFAHILPGISSVLASNLALGVISGILNLLISKRHASEVEGSLKTLLANPMRTGIDQLRIALELESHPSGDARETEYRVDRFRDALRSFDQALSNASEAEKRPIHLYRAMTSMRVPGGEHEAAIHLSRFSDSCRSRAEILEAQATSEDAHAAREQQQAAEIQVGPPRAGGGLIGMDQSQLILRKKSLEQSAAEHKQRASLLRAKGQNLRNSAKAAEFICNSTWTGFGAPAS